MQAMADNSIEVLPVEHLPEYVIGFPVHVAITVRAASHVSFARLPFADLTDLRSSIGVEYTGPAGPGESMPESRLNPESGRRGEPLAEGETRRMLADVSPLFESPAEGAYQARFFYLTPRASYSAAPVRFRFRRPTPAEANRLALFAPDRPRFDDWASWTTVCPLSPVHTGPIDPADPLRFNLLFRRLICGPDPLDRVAPAVLDVLTGLYAPERLALQAELDHARNDEASYRQLRSQILQTQPGLAWWIRMIDRGGAYLQTFRKDRP